MVIWWKVSLLSSPNHHTYIQELHVALYYWPFQGEIHWRPVYSPHKRPVMRKIFLCPYVIISRRSIQGCNIHVTHIKQVFYDISQTWCIKKTQGTVSIWICHCTRKWFSGKSPLKLESLYPERRSLFVLNDGWLWIFSPCLPRPTWSPPCKH